MGEQIITVTKLSEKIGLNRGTLITYLCRFGKYTASNGNEWKYRYKYNYYFLTELKQFFAKKMYDHNGQHFARYYQVVENIQKLIDEL